MHRPLYPWMFGAARPNAGLGLAVLVPMLLAGMLVGSSALAQAGTQPANSGPPAAAPPPANSAPAPASQAATKSGPAVAPRAAKTAPKPAPAKSVAPAARNLPNRFAGRAGAYYKVVWGVDSLVVKWTESGEVIRFSWRVLDAELAKVLNDKKVEPSLIDPQRGVGLVVPTMEKIGQLRQSAPPEVGRSYWMAFSNKGRLVKRGDRVNVVVGPFHADGLVVD
jgi:hypothetical protein